MIAYCSLPGWRVVGSAWTASRSLMRSVLSILPSPTPRNQRWMWVWRWSCLALNTRSVATWSITGWFLSRQPEGSAQGSAKGGAEGEGKGVPAFALPLYLKVFQTSQGRGWKKRHFFNSPREWRWLCSSCLGWWSNCQSDRWRCCQKRRSPSPTYAHSSYWCSCLEDRVPYTTRQTWWR